VCITAQEIKVPSDKDKYYIAIASCHNPPDKTTKYPHKHFYAAINNSAADAGHAALDAAGAAPWSATSVAGAASMIGYAAKGDWENAGLFVK
jgi:hypothetical protein